MSSSRDPHPARHRIVLLDSSGAIDPRWSWRSPPPEHSIDAGAAALEVVTAGGTDFWQRTHYGFRRDDGHLLAAQIDGDFTLTARVAFRGVHQYDQAGLMVRLSESCWLKTSVEFEPDGPARLGAVVTNAGYSDWSTQDAAGLERLWFRIRRTAADYAVHVSPDGEAWCQIRIARLLEDTGAGVLAGLYACSPKAAGYRATFDEVRLEPG